MSETSTEFAEFIADFRQHGQRVTAVITKDGQLLCGKNRQRACEMLGLELRVEIYDGDDPIGYTISENKLRQQHTPAQLALIGSKLERLRRGRPNKSTRELIKSRSQIAEQLGVHVNLIDNARTLERTAIPAIIDLVRDDKVGLKNAVAYSYHTKREDQVADPKIVKSQGRLLRTPHKLAAQKDKDIVRKDKSEKLVRLSEVKKQFLPLFRAMIEQAKRHDALISKTEIGFIGARGKVILRDWENDDGKADRTGLRIVSSSRPVYQGSTNGRDNETLQVDQERDSGSDPGSRP